MREQLAAPPIGAVRSGPRLAALGHLVSTTRQEDRMKFTKATNAKAQGDAIVFEMETAGVTRQFEISGDVLRRRFGAADDTAPELLRAFERSEDALRDLAHRTQWVPTDGPIAVGEGDFG
ncbi:DUF1488 family protein [Achromobacter mucicolens]|uniref:DUF1488 family protein n=1 Tax=Achromobacter mucicolens TaxID=1389922 RepID=UPI001CBDC3D7|nr:DUF1488 family protein [Achromobacter mucicolens]